MVRGRGTYSAADIIKILCSINILTLWPRGRVLLISGFLHLLNKVKVIWKSAKLRPLGKAKVVKWLSGAGHTPNSSRHGGLPHILD